MNLNDVEGTIEMAKAALAQMGQQRAEDDRRVRMIQAQPIPDNDE